VRTAALVAVVAAALLIPAVPAAAAPSIAELTAFS
jgi:hypothetical protein